MIIAVTLIVVLLVGSKFIPHKSTEVKVEDNAVTVSVATAAMMNSFEALSYKANLEPAEEAVVSSKATGQVIQVSFEDGDKVTAGQILAQLDDTTLKNNLSTAQISLNQLKLDLASKQNDYGTADQLYQNGAISKTSFDAAKLAYQSALSNVQLKQVDIQNLTNSISDCVIRAAINGEVVDKSVQVGQFVTVGTKLGTVKNNTTINASIQLVQEDLDKLTVGQTVQMKLKDTDSKVYNGIVKNIAHSADDQTRVFNCLIQLDNSSGELKSGITGVIEIPQKDNKKILAIPMSGLSGSDGDYSVFTLEDHHAKKVSVTIGAMSQDRVEITSGIKEGDQVIISNINSLQNGDKVVASGKGN